MKKAHILIFATFFAAFLSCTKEMPADKAGLESGRGKNFTFEAVMADSANCTKTVVHDETAVYWSPYDSIKVFYGSESCGKFIGTNPEPAVRTTFKGTFNINDGTIDTGADDTPFFGLYPYSDGATCSGDILTVTVPANQTAAEGTFAPDLFPAIAKSSGQDFAFYNVCGGIMFTLSRDDITSVTFNGNNYEKIAGSADVGVDAEGKPQVVSFTSPSTQITVCAPGGSSFKQGVKYYIVAYPANLSGGWTIAYNKADSVGIYTTSSSKTIKRSTFGEVVDKDKDATFEPIVPIMSGANCFVISNFGPAKFDCTKKGNSDESVGQVASAEVLWESFGTPVAPCVGDIVSDVSYSDGKISLTANADGNAVIAVKDAGGTILWSWHIWVCKGFDPVAAAQVYNNDAGTMMDRNLGALSASPGDLGAFGLLYQWGRKDPFLGNESVTSESPYGTSAASTITWPRATSSNADKGTIAFAIANPTKFITCDTLNNDWYYTGSEETDNTRWMKSDVAKTMYDPCPAGWRVPDGGDNGEWSKAFGLSTEFSKGPWDSTNRGMDFGSGNGKGISMQLGPAETIWYPAAGCRSYSVGGIKYPGSNGYYWTCSPGTPDAYSFFFDLTGKVVISSGRERAAGRSVRCVKE